MELYHTALFLDSAECEQHEKPARRGLIAFFVALCPKKTGQKRKTASGIFFL
jgi:hypothetical protein